jgi:hypothetical protein
MNYFRKLVSVLLIVVILLTITPATLFANAVKMSEEFRAVLTDGKLVLNSAKPESMDDEIIWIAADDFYFGNLNFMFNPDTFSEDFSKVELSMYAEETEKHIVDVVWNYDAEILEGAQAIADDFPEEWSSYIHLELSDLELINYWAYYTPGRKSGALANYSSELKSALGESNFYFEVQVYGGGYIPFYTTNGGVARMLHNGIVYKSLGGINAKANHVIYVPENTADTKEALMAAAQKRIDDYIGENVIKITDSGETVSEYYDRELAVYDANLADAIAKLDEVRVLLAAEEAKEESLRDQNLIDYYTRDIASCEQIIELINNEQQKEKPDYIDFNEVNEMTDTAMIIFQAYNDKISFNGDFAEDGIYHFLSNATGGYIFDVEVLEKGETHKFVIIKDDTKLAVPTFASTDFKTNVQVSTDSSEVPLDTLIKVEKITHGEEHERICGTLEIKDGEIFDIKLHSGSLDDYITELKNGKFKVRLPIKNEYKGKELVVYYVDANGNKTKYNVTVKNNFAFFETDHFSIYTLTYESEEGGDVLLPGDCNGDFDVNATDLAIMKLFLAGSRDLSDTDKLGADFNRDGEINATDLAMLKLKLAGNE